MKNSITVQLILLFLLASSGLQTVAQSGQEDIIETVTVKNVTVTVRVYDGKKPVPGLKKEDFNLTIDGKPQSINGFFTERKIISPNATPSATPSATPDSPGAVRPRLFLLLFNVAGYRQDLSDTLSYFFNKVIRPDDRLMVMTNHYYFPQWKIQEPEKTKREILKLLDKEMLRFRADLKRFENELLSETISLKSEISAALNIEKDTGVDMTGHVSGLYKNFFLVYRFILEDLRNQFLEFPIDHYIKIARYLRGQQGDKYVINFFQVGRIPMMDSMGPLYKTMENFWERSNSSARQIRILYQDFMMEIPTREEKVLNDLSKAFLNSGCTFHTMLLNPMMMPFSTDFKYESIASNTEVLLKKLTKQTGGGMLRSNKISKFVERITAREDIIYTLTYVPPAGKKTREKINISATAPGGEKYRLVYDNQDRIKAFQRAEQRLLKRGPDLAIQKLVYYNQSVIVKLNNITLVNYENEEFGAVEARVKVMGKGKKPLHTLKKVFRGIREEGMFQLMLPKLNKGKYHLVVEAKDLFSLDDKYTGDGIDIKVR